MYNVGDISREFMGHNFVPGLRTLGTPYHQTLDPAVLWTPSNDTSRPIFSDSLNLTPPAPLYLRTLWCYTNAVIIIIIIIIIWVDVYSEISLE